MICQPHFERGGQRIEATRVVADTPMCEECFSGKSFGGDEEESASQGLSVIKKQLWATADPAKRERMLSNLRRPWTPEMRRKISQTRRMKFRTEWDRKKLSEEMRRRWADPETRQRMIEGRHGSQTG